MSQFYYYVWGLYGAGALGLFYLGWLLLRRIRVRVVSHVLLALLAALLFTPAKIIPQQDDLTPAVMVVLLDGIAQGWPGVWAGLKYILLVYAGLLSVVLLLHLIKVAIRPRRQNAEGGSPPAKD